MKKPCNRKERINFIRKKFGNDVVSAFASLTDKEVRNYFEEIYPSIKNKEDYKYKSKESLCIKCNDVIEITYNCQCGSCYFLEEDWKSDIKYNLENGLENDLDEQDMKFMSNGYKLIKED